MLKRRKFAGVPPDNRVEALLDHIATFRLLPAPIAVGFSSMGRQTTHNTLKWMANEKLIRRYTFGAAYSPQLRRTSAYYLTQKAVNNYQNVSWCPPRYISKPPDKIALWAFHRSSLFLALHRDGFSVGRTGQHLLGLRRFVVDSQREATARLDGPAKVAAERTLEEIRRDESFLPPAQLVCKSCGLKSEIAKLPKQPCGCGKENSSWRVVEYRLRCNTCKAETFGLAASECCDSPRQRREDTVSYDIATHPSPPKGLPRAAIVIVDLPDSSVPKTLEALPLRIRGQPKIPVILRPAGAETIFDLSTNRYRLKGSRFRSLTRAFSPDMGRGDSKYPYHRTSKVLTYRPDIGQRTLSRDPERKR